MFRGLRSELPGNWRCEGVKDRSMRQAFVLCMVVGIGSGCTLDAGSRGPFGPEDPETAAQKAKLPEEVPSPHSLQFTGEETAGHHKPKMVGVSGETAVKRAVNESVVLTADEVATFRTVAENDRGVIPQLGSRWAFIDADRIPPDGKITFGCCRQTTGLVRLVYYSYSQNVAVEVRVKKSGVLSVDRRDGYQPPEGQQDVQRGIELAKADPRLVGKVDQLQGHGLLMQPDQGFFRNDPGYGHRTIWITFSEGQGGDPKFWAVIDLTEDKVLEAGEEPPRS